MEKPTVIGPIKECQDLLRGLGISCEVDQNILFVNRTSMVRASPESGESEAYEVVLALLQEFFAPNWYVYFGGRSDESYAVEFWHR